MTNRQPLETWSLPTQATAEIALAERVANRLRQGQAAILPAEGVYGVHLPALAPAAAARLDRIKGYARPRPYILLVASLAAAERWVDVLAPAARAYLGRVWPGPVTALLPAAAVLPERLAPHGEVAVRCPGRRWLRALLDCLAEPLLSTSANRAGEAPPASLAAVADEVRRACGLAVDGGPLAGVSSTIVRLGADGSTQILRAGQGGADWGPDAP